MSQREGETNYKYEDYASEMAYHRLPQSEALVGRDLRITLDSGSVFELRFEGPHQVSWRSGTGRGTDWGEAVEVAPQAYFIDLTFAQEPRQSQTFLINLQTRQVLGIRTIMRAGDVGREPRAVHEFSPGILGDPTVPPTGCKPAPTRDLVGLRALYTYNPNQCFEHIYLNTKRYVWHCVVGPLKGEADVDFHTTYKFDTNQYVFCFREFGLPVSTVFFHNWDQMRETGKFFAIGEDGTVANTPAGALIRKLSVTFYPEDQQPF
ncbi:MAG: MoaF N-terminal domain-containing protein [Deltaproteobacteria bacterium]|nr:MoaF N-terminal domain-containing protein [Deltaproteobacteria bacterium]